MNPIPKEAPRISVNKLGEYLITANPYRRKKIIHDQKYGNPPISPLYRQAFAPIEGFLSSGGFNIDDITNAIDRLQSDRSGSDWVVRDRENTAEALECFLEIAESLIDDTVTYERGADQPPKLQIAGVQVSVRPDFLLRFCRRGIQCIGALKFHFIKDNDNALTEAGGQYVGTLLYQWLQEYGPKDAKADYTHCLVVDCFRKQITPAPASHKRRMQHIEAGCGEIASNWSTIQPL